MEGNDVCLQSWGGLHRGVCISHRAGSSAVLVLLFMFEVRSAMLVPVHKPSPALTLVCHSSDRWDISTTFQPEEDDEEEEEEEGTGAPAAEAK